MADKTDRYRDWLGPVAPLDAARVWQRIEARVQPATPKPRARRSWLVLAPLLAAAIVAGYVVLNDGAPERVAALRLADGSAPALLSSDLEAKTVALSDGSQIELAQQTALRTHASTATRFETELQRGRAVFDVVPHGPRVWSVRAADVEVKVLGTRFSVALDDSTVHVAVERGKVQVTSPALGGTRILQANQSLQLSAAITGVPSRAKAGATYVAEQSSPAPEDDAAATREAIGGDARDRTRSDRAVDARARPQAPRAPRGELEVAGPDAGIEAWLQRADAARAAGQPGKAASALERALADHPRDPRTALAAFTLAQLYMEQLAQPREAARAFERASALGLPAALAEEAAARRVEAYARAGLRVQAQKAAETYRAKYPNGARASAVTRWLSELQ